jgi:hypothetical protein
MANIKSIMQRLIILMLLGGLFSFDSPKLVRTQVAEGISILIPADWQLMDNLDFTERYPSVRAPIAAYTDRERLADISVNISATQWPDSDIELAKDFFKSSIYNSFDRIDMIDEGIHEVNHMKFVFFEFESTIKGNPKNLGQQSSILGYSYIQYLIQPGRTLVFSFHCPRRMRTDWQDTARKIMTGIKVK